MVPAQVSLHAVAGVSGQSPSPERGLGSRVRTKSGEWPRTQSGIEPSDLLLLVDARCSGKCGEWLRGGGGKHYEPADRWHIVKTGSQVEGRASAEASRRCVLLWQLWRLAACGGQRYEPPAYCRPLASCEDWEPSRRLGARRNQFFVLLIPPTQEGGMRKRQGLVHGLVTNVTPGQWHPATHRTNITKS